MNYRLAEIYISLGKHKRGKQKQDQDNPASNIENLLAFVGCGLFRLDGRDLRIRFFVQDAHYSTLAFSTAVAPITARLLGTHQYRGRQQTHN